MLDHFYFYHFIHFYCFFHIFGKKVTGHSKNENKSDEKYRYIISHFRKKGVFYEKVGKKCPVILFPRILVPTILPDTVVISKSIDHRGW